MSTSWTFANVHDQHGTITKAADGSWSWLVDSVNDVDPPTESISVNGSTVQMSFTQDGTSYLRYTWPSSVSSSDGDIVAADGTAVTGFTHSWGHTSLGTGSVTITLDSSGTGGGGGMVTQSLSYSATLGVNSSGWLEYTIPTTSGSGSYYLLKSSDGITWTQHGQTITHGVLETQGSFVFDQTLVWIIRSPLEDELARWTPILKKVFCNFW